MPLRFPNGHGALILSRAELAILERVITERFLVMRMNAEHGREAELVRGRTRTLGTRISRLIAHVGDSAQVPPPLNVSIDELRILDDLVDPLSSVRDDAACEELLEKIERLILSAAT